MMTDKERLTNIIHNAQNKYLNLLKFESSILADYLLANGVIVLPCQKGTVLNRNGEKCIANHWNIILTAFNEDNHVRLFDIKEAEAKLKEREGE